MYVCVNKEICGCYVELMRKKLKLGTLVCLFGDKCSRDPVANLMTDRRLLMDHCNLSACTRQFTHDHHSCCENVDSISMKENFPIIYTVSFNIVQTWS